MKKLIALLLSLALVFALAACGAPAESSAPAESAQPSEESAAPSESAEAIEPVETALKVIKVGASPTPHAELLAQVKEVLKEQGYDLQIVEFTDYVQPNLALDDGSLDANFFQHEPYLLDFNAERGTKLVSAAAIHYEPMGIFPGKVASFDELEDGAQIAVPNDTTNEARALLLLQEAGLIKVDDSKGLTTTPRDITENPKNLKIVELEAAQIPRSLQDVAMAVINGNYAMQADMTVADDAIAKEEKESLAAETYANIIAVREGDENREEIQALIAALKSDAIRTYIEETYNGAVVAMF